MLRRAAVLKRICDRRRAQNAFKVQCQSFAGMITQDSERSYTDITTLTLSIKNTMPEFLLFSCAFNCQQYRYPGHCLFSRKRSCPWPGFFLLIWKNGFHCSNDVVKSFQHVFYLDYINHYIRHSFFSYIWLIQNDIFAILNSCNMRNTF